MRPLAAVMVQLQSQQIFLKFYLETKVKVVHDSTEIRRSNITFWDACVHQKLRF